MKRLCRSFKDAFAGLYYCFSTQHNMVIHLAMGILAIALAISLKVPFLEFLLLLTAVFCVLVAEAFNTALEKAVDAAAGERNEFAHIAKDVAAGAVLLTVIYALLVGFIIFGPRLWALLVM